MCNVYNLQNNSKESVFRLKLCTECEKCLTKRKTILVYIFSHVGPLFSIKVNNVLLGLRAERTQRHNLADSLCYTQ